MEGGVQPVHLFRVSFCCPSRGGGTREAGGTVAGSVVGCRNTGQAYRDMLYWAIEHQIRRGRRVARSSTSQGSTEALCAIITGNNMGVSLGKNLIFLRKPTRISEHARF